MRRLHEFEFGGKPLYASFLLFVDTGYLMALVYLYTSHVGHDGKPGLSVEDIMYNYYGDRTGTRLEATIRGSVARRVMTGYGAAATPPTAKVKIRLSTSKPVRCARPKRLGGFQYRGTNNGSVSPNGAVNKLAQRMAFRWEGNAT